MTIGRKKDDNLERFTLSQLPKNKFPGGGGSKYFAVTNPHYRKNIFLLLFLSETKINRVCKSILL